MAADPKFTLYRKKKNKRISGTIEDLADEVCESLGLPKGSIDLLHVNDPDVDKDKSKILGAIRVVKKECGNCKSQDATICCASCKMQYYCTKECQKAHWKTHKLTCKNLF